MRLDTSLLCGLLIITLTACDTSQHQADLASIYNREAQASDLERNPVIVIPGILGSRLYDDAKDIVVWGAFNGNFANPQTPEGARIFAQPMANQIQLKYLRDKVRPDGVLETLEVNLAGLPITLEAYRNILVSLGVGGYRDESLGVAGAIDYGDDHFTCFQFDYDWRRDNVENAHRLHQFILDKKAYVRKELLKRYGVDKKDLKFDIVSHSMGGLVTRYYLRYGDADLPANGTPTVTWAGAKHVERVILVGTPNAGSLSALKQLVEGIKFAPILPKYESAILGTMPSIYQLLPRNRHHTIITSNGEPIKDILDISLWKRMGWGLASADQDHVITQLLPDIKTPEKRREIALDHLSKMLFRAKQFHVALDLPASPPSGLQIHLFAGDAKSTPSQITVSDDGSVAFTSHAPGDGTVTRASALMDERIGGKWSSNLRSPIRWAGVHFIFADHLGLTKDVAFTDNLLYLLLEAPK